MATTRRTASSAVVAVFAPAVDPEAGGPWAGPAPPLLTGGRALRPRAGAVSGERLIPGFFRPLSLGLRLLLVGRTLWWSPPDVGADRAARRAGSCPTR